MRILPIILGASLLLAAAAHADYGPMDKLSRGVANIVAGVLVFPGSIVQETREDGAAGIPAGIGLGLVRIVARELVGVYELITFPIPPPGNYAPVLQPPYPWDYFAGGSS